MTALSTLGPKVLATRMVRDYVEELYTPAARASWALDGPTSPGAKELAAFKKAVKHNWSQVRVDHVEPAGLSDSPQIGETLSVRAYVSLGDLAPEQVSVQLVHGRAGDYDELQDTANEPLQFVETTHDGQHVYAGSVTLSRTGSFGYTVRVLPQHAQLASPASLGLVANA